HGSSNVAPGERPIRGPRDTAREGTGAASRIESAERTRSMLVCAVVMPIARQSRPGPASRRGSSVTPLTGSAPRSSTAPATPRPSSGGRRSRAGGAGRGASAPDGPAELVQHAALDAAEELVDLGIGERAGLGTEHEPEGERLLARADLRAAVHVEQRDRLEKI